MLSSAGDVIVCRCRRSSTPFLPPKARDSLDVWDKQFPCCDTELLSNIDGPWSPAILENVTAQRNGRARTGSVSQISTTTEFSTYEWEKSNNESISSTTNNMLGVKGLKGGSLSSNQHHNQASFDFVTKRKSDKKSNHDNNNNNKKKNTKEDHTIDMIGTERKQEDSSTHSTTWDNNVSDDLILSLPSFDYSHIIDGHNDM